MGPSSNSDSKRDINDEGVAESRESSNAFLDQNEGKHRDHSRRKHRHHHRDSIDDRNAGEIEEQKASRIERDRNRGRKIHEKKHRRDRSKKGQYSADDNDEIRESSKKRHHRKHHSRRDDSERDSDKQKKRKRNDDDKRKKSRKESNEDATEVFDSIMKSKQVDKIKLYSLGEKLGHPPNIVLDPENDYFTQNQRFRIYLYRECGLTFDELTSNDARAKFKDFVQQYNTGDLEDGYYTPHVPIEAIEECPSTRHQWSLKITNQDSKNLQMLQEGIRKQTEYQSGEIHHSSGTDVNKIHSVANNNEKELVNRSHIDQNTRAMNRRLREHAQTTMEELTGGRKDGHERQIEKRQERAAKIHGASKYQQDMVELDDAALYGGNTDDNFRRLAAASRERAAAQKAKKEERILELQRKEKEKQNAMLQMLGLSHKIGQSKIQIKPRNDPLDNV